MLAKLVLLEVPVALDPRLASVELLALAALRAKQRQGSQTDLYQVTWLGMDGLPENPEDAERSPSGVYLPRKCQTAEEWYHSPLIAGMRAKLREPGGEACPGSGSS
jgi:hypothetical protein